MVPAPLCPLIIGHGENHHPFLLKTFQRLLGICAILPGGFFLWLSSLHAAQNPPPPRDLSEAWVFGVALILPGIMSLLTYRLGTWALTGMSAAFGLTMIIGGLLETPFPWSLINIYFGALFLLPAIFLWNLRPRQVQK